jgi:hypothetical protein
MQPTPRSKVERVRTQSSFKAEGPRSAARFEQVGAKSYRLAEFGIRGMPCRLRGPRPKAIRLPSLV